MVTGAGVEEDSVTEINILQTLSGCSPHEGNKQNNVFHALMIVSFETQSR